jgi:hypothetical protein
MSSKETLVQINKLLSTLSRDDLAMVNLAIHNRLDILNKNAFKLGDTVMFDAKRRGVKQGIVISVPTGRLKNVKVLVGSTRWTVSPNLLKKVA